MKFMKLGSKPDLFQTDGENIRYVATELATDMVISVGDTKFYLHKFPLLSKSSRLQKLVSSISHEPDDEIEIHDIPGGPAAFEICAKFCYNMTVTLNAYNVVSARCAAQYLEMFEDVEKGNLAYKIDVFLASSIFRKWKDSIIVLQTTKSLIPWSEELNIVAKCVDSIATKVSTDPSKVDWSFTNNRKKISFENGNRPFQNWWVEDLCELQIDLFNRVLIAVRAKGRISEKGIGIALEFYVSRRVQSFVNGVNRGGDFVKYRYLVDTVISLLPKERSCVSCGLLLKLLNLSTTLECGEMGRVELMEAIARQLEEASVGDFLVFLRNDETTPLDVDIVHELVERFARQEFVGDDSKMKVARLVDGYLAQIARDPSLPLSKFVDLGEIVSTFPRPTHDGIYRAIDTYLKEHPGLSKSEKKRICQLMDCKKLSSDACSHAVQNDRLPLRVVMQVLFFEQAREAPSRGGSSTPDLPASFQASGSHGSSRSNTTNTEEEDQTSEEIKAIKREIASLRLKRGGNVNTESIGVDKVKTGFLNACACRDRREENSVCSETYESIDTRSTPSRSGRY